MEYSKDYIAELMKWVDPYSIIVIAEHGQLIRLRCPFEVMTVVPVRKLIAGDIVTVEAVKITMNLENVFIIQDRAYFLFYFKILL